MSNEEVQRSINLQRAISERLAEFAFANPEQAERISRQLAEIATRGKSFADNTLPLFLQMPVDNPTSVAQVALALKVQLDELTDSLVDLRRDLSEFAEFFVSRS